MLGWPTASLLLVIFLTFKFILVNVKLSVGKVNREGDMVYLLIIEMVSSELI